MQTRDEVEGLHNCQAPTPLKTMYNAEKDKKKKINFTDQNVSS